ncbi:MAG: hypothetical protein AB7K36_17125 [Chloroflexota bacterium]
MMMTLAGSLATSVDPGHHTVNDPELGPAHWAREFQAHLGRLLARDAEGSLEQPPEVSAGAAGESAGVQPSATDEDVGARLEGVRLAAREIAHLVNNDLALTVDTLDLLRGRSDISPSVRELLEQALAGLHEATHHVAQLQRVQRVVTRETPAGPSLDLDRSV